MLLARVAPSMKKLSLGFRQSLMCLTVQLWLVTSHLRLDLIEVTSDVDRRNPEDMSLSMDSAKKKQNKNAGLPALSYQLLSTRTSAPTVSYTVTHFHIRSKRSRGKWKAETFTVGGYNPAVFHRVSDCFNFSEILLCRGFSSSSVESVHSNRKLNSSCSHNPICELCPVQRWQAVCTAQWTKQPFTAH